MSKRRKTKPKKKETFLESLWSLAKTIFWALIVVMIINGLAFASFVVPTPSMEKTVLAGDFLFVNKFLYGPSTPQVIPFVNQPLPFYKFPGLKDPEKGDVIVFIFPGNRDEVEPKQFMYYLKRCIATAGDTLQIKNNQVYVNNKIQELPEHGQYISNGMSHQSDRFATFPFGRNYTRDNYGPIRIPKKGDKIKLSVDNIREWDVFISREGHEVTAAGTKVYIDGKEADSYTVQRDYCFGMGDNRDNSLDSRFFGFIPYENVVGTPMIVYWSWDPNISISKFVDKLSTIRFSRIGTIIE